MRYPLANKFKGVIFYAKSFKDIRKNRLVVEEMEFKSKWNIFLLPENQKGDWGGVKTNNAPIRSWFVWSWDWRKEESAYFLLKKSMVCICRLCIHLKTKFENIEFMMTWTSVYVAIMVGNCSRFNEYYDFHLDHKG